MPTRCFARTLKMSTGHFLRPALISPLTKIHPPNEFWSLERLLLKDAVSLNAIINSVLTQTYYSE